MAYTDLFDGNGRPVRVLVGNESEDGSGTWHVIVTDSSGYPKVKLQAMAADLDMGAYDLLHVDSIFGSTSILPVRIGNAATTSHSLASEDDLLVTGKLEVDGYAIFDAGVQFWDSLIASQQRIELSFFLTSGAPVGVLFSDFGYDQCGYLVGDDQGNQFIIGNYLSARQDFDHAAQTNPTLYIHSDTPPDTANDEWISLTHNVTDGVIAVGSGVLQLPATVNVATAYQVAATQVVGARVIDARADDVVDTTYGAEEAGVLDALRDAMITHGLIAAA